MVALIDHNAVVLLRGKWNINRMFSPGSALLGNAASWFTNASCLLTQRTSQMTTKASHLYYNIYLASLHALPKQGA